VKQRKGPPGSGQLLGYSALVEPVREPAVAARFYPSEPERLRSSVGVYLGNPGPNPVEARAVVAPHAGYVYSGKIAGETYAKVSVPRVVFVLCPNHTGFGVKRSLWPKGHWRLPGFDVPVDEELAASALEHAKLTEDHLAHVREHAIEVHLPFLYALRSDVRIVPLCLAGLAFAECEEVGRGIARAISDFERAHAERVMIVASTDMSHYISADEARVLDRMAIDRVRQLDAEGLYTTVKREEISMCGYIPTTVALVAARELGSVRAELVRYGNSGETSGNFDEVVGYAGLYIS
jgi:AmmeMemoRadiSam system protein B